MKSTHYFNVTFYVLIIALYIYEPIIGALSQIGLGVFQLVLAIKLSLEKNTYSLLAQKALKIYWYAILIWIIGIIIISLIPLIEALFITLIYIVPMTLGFYFTIITYLIQKK